MEHNHKWIDKGIVWRVMDERINGKIQRDQTYACECGELKIDKLEPKNL